MEMRMDVGGGDKKLKPWQVVIVAVLGVAGAALYGLGMLPGGASSRGPVERAVRGWLESEIMVERGVALEQAIAKQDQKAIKRLGEQVGTSIQIEALAAKKWIGEGELIVQARYRVGDNVETRYLNVKQISSRWEVRRELNVDDFRRRRLAWYLW